jgi:hypothetical protein
MLTRDPGLLPSGHPAEIPQLLGAFEVWVLWHPSRNQILILAPPLSGSPALWLPRSPGRKRDNQSRNQLSYRLG